MKKVFILSIAASTLIAFLFVLLVSKSYCYEENQHLSLRYILPTALNYMALNSLTELRIEKIFFQKSESIYSIAFEEKERNYRAKEVFPELMLAKKVAFDCSQAPDWLKCSNDYYGYTLYSTNKGFASAKISCTPTNEGMQCIVSFLKEFSEPKQDLFKPVEGKPFSSKALEEMKKISYENFLKLKEINEELSRKDLIQKMALVFSDESLTKLPQEERIIIEVKKRNIDYLIQEMISEYNEIYLNNKYGDVFEDGSKNLEERVKNLLEIIKKEEKRIEEEQKKIYKVVPSSWLSITEYEEFSKELNEFGIYYYPFLKNLVEDRTRFETNLVEKALWLRAYASYISSEHSKLQYQLGNAIRFLKRTNKKEINGLQYRIKISEEIKVDLNWLKEYTGIPVSINMPSAYDSLSVEERNGIVSIKSLLHEGEKIGRLEYLPYPFNIRIQGCPKNCYAVIEV